MEKELTGKQVEALAAIAAAGNAGASPWDFGSTTIWELKRRGLIVKTAGMRYVAAAVST